MKTKFLTGVKTCLFALIFLLLFLPFSANGIGRYALNSLSARAESEDLIKIEAYSVDMTVYKDRKIEVKESITVTFLDYGLSMYYRSLPTDGARYSNIVASCEGNEAFSYHVADNPDVDGFIDINCVGAADYGKTWTYDISYTMEQGADTVENGMTIDVVGFGWTVPLHNVTATVRLPESLVSYDVYTDIFGTQTQNEVRKSVSGDGKTITLQADVLERYYSEKYYEYVTSGITLEFTLPEGVLEGYVETRMFTEDIGNILLGACLTCLAAAALLIFTHNKREIVTVVNVNPPEGMDPMKMGKFLDGVVNQEDATAMIYYFANKGYLRIDMTLEEDPELVSCVRSLPSDAPVYEKTLFDGIFKKGNSLGSFKAVRVSECAESFYEAMLEAKMQLPSHPTMYEKKSLFGFIGGFILAALYGVLTCLAMGNRVGGGYIYPVGFLFILPVLGFGVMGYFCENYRYKWSKGKRMGMLALEALLAAAFSALVIFFVGRFIMTEWEKLVLCLGVFGACFIAQGALTRTEEYANSIGDILGFKEFIVVTEEDKIAFMLEENPELYYDILPYAQVLGVTDEWTDKFKRLTVEPPSWYYGGRVSAFDCYIIHRSFGRSMAREMAKAFANKNGGAVGHSGGGRSFGGFGGGGFGGGGGGAR